MLGQSKTAYPGGDRRGVRADRLLALQRRVRAGALRRAADQRAAHVEPDGLPPARRLRLRRLAVQLHGHRRQPAGRAGADGQHRALEAGGDARCSRGYYIMQAARGGGPAAGRDQLRARRRGRDLRHRCSTHRDLAGVHFTGSTGVFNSMWKTSRRRTSATTAAIRASSARPAARTSSSRTRRPIRRRWRSAIVRGAFEYQGQKCSAASRVYVPQSLWPDVRDRDGRR